jgi:hypothetical protein
LLIKTNEESDSKFKIEIVELKKGGASEII